MRSRVHPLALAGMLLAARAAQAAPCPAVEVSGDPALVSLVTGLLAEHVSDGADCPTVRARLERRGAAIAVVHLGAAETTLEERIVSEPATAATVIESWTRSDLEMPLLAVHPLVRVASAPQPILQLSYSETPFPAPRLLPNHIVHVTGALESSFADDRTSWVGGVVGLCVQVGRVCISTRGRFATVVTGPGMWKTAERRGFDVVFGGDVPFELSATSVVVGFGAGMGAVRTVVHETAMDDGSLTFGLRADAHIAWVIPIAHRISFDLSASIDLAQVTDVEKSRGSLADEPRILGRLGAGLRFGGR